jgi:ATP-dependent DNA ligase
VAIPTDAGFSFDLLVNRLRVSAARLAQEVKANPAIYIAFDILADKSKSLLRASFSRRRRGLEEFFRKYGSGEGPLYLSANTSELGEVQNWINHIGLQLDGVVAKKADAIYDPGNKRAVLKIKTILVLFRSVAIEFLHGLDRLRNSTKRRSLPRKKRLRNFVAFVF